MSGGWKKRDPKDQVRLSEDGLTATVILTKGQVAVIDAEDAKMISQNCWHAAPSRGCFYAYRGEFSDNKSIAMHRQIMNASAGEFVDHANEDTLDNRKSNLRICTNSQNMANSSKNRSKGRFPYKGVSLNRQGKYVARIRGGRDRNIHLGVFVEMEDAARAYDRAAKERYGVFAVLNFPEDG
jgi:hypothetical protein